MLISKTKEETKILFVNPCLRRGSVTKILPVGVTCVMTYLHENGYKFELLDIDINEYEDSYVENFIKNNDFRLVLSGST